MVHLSGPRRLGVAWCVLLSLLAVTACNDQAQEPSATDTAVRWETFVGWDAALDRFDPETVQWVDGVAGSVPENLPERALPQIHFLTSKGAPLTDSIVQLDDDGIVRMQLVVGNPSGRTNRPESVLCFVDQKQQPCTEGADTWELETPGDSIAFLPLRFAAESGSRIDVFLIPADQPGYPFPASVGFSAFIEEEQEMTSEVALEPEDRVWPFDGCGFARVLRTEPPIEEHRIPVDVSREESLFLAIELCHPDQVVNLVPIADRHRIVEIDDPVWRSPVRLQGQTSLLPIRPAWFSDAEEFQIAVVPADFGPEQRAVLFSDAVSFK